MVASPEAPSLTVAQTPGVGHPLGANGTDSSLVAATAAAAAAAAAAAGVAVGAAGLSSAVVAYPSAVLEVATRRRGRPAIP